MNTLFAVSNGIVVVLAVILLYFSAQHLPELAKAFGLGFREFKKELEYLLKEL